MFQMIKNWFGKSENLSGVNPGDRVWAPWEGQFLYSATVIGVVGTSVNVRYDTGEERSDLASNLRPLQPEKQLKSGQQIFMMLDKEARSYMFAPAKVARVHGELVDVICINGAREAGVHVKRIRILEADIPLNLPPEWTLRNFVRIPDQPAGAARELDPLYQANDRVLARWQDYYWYPATILNVGPEVVEVRYADGDMGLLSDKHLMPLFCEEGERIYIRPPEEARLMYFPAVVKSVDGELLDVEFDATDVEEGRHVAGLSINRARFWRLPKGIRSRSFNSGDEILVLLGDHWYPGRILPERRENTYGPMEDVVFVELLYAAHDVMVTPELIKPLKFAVGDKIECGRGGTSYVPGTIKEIKADKILVTFP